MITARGLTRTFAHAAQDRGGRARGRPRRRVRRTGRLPRPERSRQDDHPAHAHHAAQPTSGEATSAGATCCTDPAGVRARIGYVGQGNGGGLDQQVGDELVLQGRLYGLSSAEGAGSAPQEMAETFELTDLAQRLVITLSGGQKRRLDIALGVLHRPALVFLDEPSTGLDPQSRDNLWRHIRSTARRARRDGVPDHALPRRGGRAVRPDHHHRQRRDRRGGLARRVEAPRRR